MSRTVNRSTKSARNKTHAAKLRHDGIIEKRIGEIHPAPENDRLYRPVDPNDPEIIALAESIKQYGIREPIVITLDGYIVSGHRRYAAAKLAGLKTVVCRVLPIKRTDDIDQFVVLLREHNRQRDKSLAEKLREELTSADPHEAHRALSEYRSNRSALYAETFEIEGFKTRAEISCAKQPMLDTILKVIADRRKFWPLSDRAIHYGLLNDPPLKHASKPDSVYCNDRKSYQSLVELLTRARLAGLIDWHAIHDPTRPVSTWQVYDSPRGFIREQIDDFLKGYYRALMQSQPNHVEIVAEKNTVEPIVRPIAMEYTIPITSGRGYCSIPPRYAMAQRYHQSGKDKLILLIISDFDPDGETIAHSFARSMRDDFGIVEVHPIKVALTAEQVKEYELPPVMTAKVTSSNYDRFVDQYGETVFELEALEPDTLQGILREAIDSVIDVDAYNSEVSAEASDAAFLDGVRKTVHVALRDMDWEGDTKL
jgi:hypothetical protein